MASGQLRKGKWFCFVVGAVLLGGCETVEAERLSEGRFLIKASIVRVAVGKPGYDGAVEYAAFKANEICPKGWVKLRDEVEVVGETRFVVWEVKCK